MGDIYFLDMSNMKHIKFYQEIFWLPSSAISSFMLFLFLMSK